MKIKLQLKVSISMVYGEAKFTRLSKIMLDPQVTAKVRSGAAIRSVLLMSASKH